MRRASLSDVSQLVGLMSEYYRESDLYIETGRASWAFSQLLSDGKLGRAWIIEADGHAVGYVVMTLALSIECGGLIAFVDDLFVQARYRRRGLGRAALGEVLEACQGLGVRAVHLELASPNPVAERLYAELGFASTGRALLTRQIQPPVHH